MKQHAQTFAPASLLSLVTELNLASTAAKDFVLSPALYCKRWQDIAGAWTMFEDYHGYKDVLLRPSPAAGPDAICVLLKFGTQEPGGFLLLQSKNHAQLLNENDLPAALKSVNPNQMFRGAKNQRPQFVAAVKKLPATFTWLRVS